MAMAEELLRLLRAESCCSSCSACAAAAAEDDAADPDLSLDHRFFHHEFFFFLPSCADVSFGVGGGREGMPEAEAAEGANMEGRGEVEFEWARGAPWLDEEERLRLGLDSECDMPAPE